MSAGSSRSEPMARAAKQSSSSPLRVLFVSHSLPPKERPLANIGGMQRVATKLLHALRDRADVELDTYLQRTAWRWIHLRTPAFLAKTWWQLRKRAQAQDVDVVLFSSMVTAPMALPAHRQLKAAGIQTAAIVHGRDVTLPFSPYQWLVPRVFDTLDAIYPVSQATAEVCRERGADDENIRVIHNGIDLNRFPSPGKRSTMRSTLKEALDTPSNPLPDDAFLLCSVGRHVERKGFSWFIDQVMPTLPENIHYWLAGTGPRSEAIQTAIDRNDLGHRVRLLGRVSESNLAKLYRGSDLFIMPNVPIEGDMEGFGVVILEANQCGCPVIASRLEGIQDVVTDGVNGHLVDVSDASSFADAIRRYHSDREALQAASQQAVEHVESTFGWRTRAEQYVQSLSELCGASTTTPASSSRPAPMAAASD